MGDLKSCQEIIKENGQEILHCVDEKGHSPLHWSCLAGYNDIARYFLSCNAPLHKGSNNELSPMPIHWACVNGHFVTVDLLLQHGVSIDATDNRHCTPLIIAAQYGKIMLVGYLIGKGARKDLTDLDGDNALHWASFKGHSEVVRLLLYSGFNQRQKDDVGQTPLHLACLSGNLTTVKVLIEQELDLFAIDNNGKTGLDLAVGRGYKDIIEFLKRRMKMQAYCNIGNQMAHYLGGERIYALFYVFVLMCFCYPMYFYHFSFLWDEDRFTNLIFLLLNVIMWYTFIKSAKYDPGYLPCNTDEYDLALKKVAQHKEWETSIENNPLSKLCHSCRLLKPLRSKHCRICNRCVDRFDHHCHFIHNCIGPKNRSMFMVFFFITLMSMYIAIYLGRQVIHQYGYTLLRFLFMLIHIICAPLFTFTFCVFILQISVNLTTNERLNYKRYSYLKDASGKYYNPFNRGFVKNWREYCNFIPPQDLENNKLESVLLT